MKQQYLLIWEDYPETITFYLIDESAFKQIVDAGLSGKLIEEDKYIDLFWNKEGDWIFSSDLIKAEELAKFGEFAGVVQTGMHL